MAKARINDINNMNNPQFQYSSNYNGIFVLFEPKQPK